MRRRTSSISGTIRITRTGCSRSSRCSERRLAGSRRARTAGAGRDRARDHGRTHRCGARQPSVLAGFSLQDVGGPPINERPDATGLFADGRFADFSHLRDRADQPANFQNRQNNMLHSLSVSDDGERVYVAGRRRVLYAEFRSDREQHRRELGGGDGRLQSTLDDRVGRRRDRCGKLRAVADDCLHMVVNDDPGLKAFLSSNAPPRRESGALSRAAHALADRRASAA